MEMSTITDISTLIVRTPEICGGRPRLAGSRISVENVVIDYRAGMTPEEIVQNKPHLTLASVYAALAYYWANQEEINQDIASEEVSWQELETKSTISA